MKRVILFSGRMGSGKNQLAQYIMSELVSRGKYVTTDLYAKNVKIWAKSDFKELSEYLNCLADALKNESEKIKGNHNSYGLVGDGITNGLNAVIEKLKICDDNWFENKTNITRILLQTYGTQIFRKRIDDMYWIKQLKNRIEMSNSEYILITDTRFPNEIDYIAESSEYETYSIRINRNIDRTGKEHQHISETALDNYNEFSYIVDNDKSLENLKVVASTIIDDLEKEDSYGSEC
jgi:KaiC/GvpD/RAD55 family RecA-like ATPase